MAETKTQPAVIINAPWWAPASLQGVYLGADRVEAWFPGRLERRRPLGYDDADAAARAVGPSRVDEPGKPISLAEPVFGAVKPECAA